MTLSLDITTKSKNTTQKKKVKKNNMTTLQNKIDFVLVVDVENANPNGDPLSGNLPANEMTQFVTAPTNSTAKVAPESEHNGGTITKPS